MEPLKKILDSVALLIPFLEPYPLWVKLLASVWLLLTAALIAAVLFARPPRQVPLAGALTSPTDFDSHPSANDGMVRSPRESAKPSDPPRSTRQVRPGKGKESVHDATNSNVLQAGRDIVINAPIQAPAQPSPLPTEKITSATRHISTPEPELPYGLEVTLQTTTEIQTPHFVLEFSTEIGKGHIRTAGDVSALFGVRTTVSESHFDFTITGPAFTPRTPLIVTVFSARPVELARVRRVY